MSYLVGITIGPVQQYIQESRKTIDLYNSSKIISEIMKNILKEIKDCDVIYPNYNNEEKVDYSNYVVLETEDFINLEDIKNKVYKDIGGDKYKININEYFHLFWAIKKIENENYYDTYKNLTKLIHDLKNTYEFDQVEQSSKKKCLICGKRNIITQNLNKQKRIEYKLNSDEDLCEVCLLKRIYKKEDSDKVIPSIYSIAIKNWKEKYKNSLIELSKKLSQLLNKSINEIDLYYNPNEIDKLIKVIENSKRGNKFSKEKLKEFQDDFRINLTDNYDKLVEIKDDMKKIYSKKNEEEKVEVPNYEYGFVQFDIDSLGCWMSDKYSNDKKHLKKYQKEISAVLCEFASKLRNSLEDKCEVIYSGGDDFLCVLPSENIVQVMEIIDRKFKNIVKTKLNKYMTYDRKITYSISSTIAQCKDPMSYALSKTREELENVKNRYKYESIEKNGVAINYIINNGKEITCYLKKEDLENYFEIIKEYEKVKTDLSFSFINNFENEFKNFNFYDLSYQNSKVLSKIFKLELKRIILRSKVKKENEEVVSKYIERLVGFMSHIFNDNKHEEKSNHEFIDFKNVINVLKIYQKLSNDNIRLIKYGKEKRDEQIS